MSAVQVQSETTRKEEEEEEEGDLGVLQRDVIQVSL